MSRLDTERLDKMRTARHLLPAPGPEVVGELIVEVDRLNARLASLEAIVGGYESLIQDTEWSTKAMDLRAAGLNESLAAWRKDGESCPA